MHQHNTIYKYIYEFNKYNTLNLCRKNIQHSLFFDQMKNSSNIGLSPKIHALYHYPNDINKIIFDKSLYFDMNDIDDIHLCNKNRINILNQYLILYKYCKFIPKTPYLGYSFNNHNNGRNWYIWSYTDIDFVDNKKDFLDKFYENGYHKNKFIDKFILDDFLNKIK